MELEKVTVTTANGEKHEGFFLDTESHVTRGREALDYAAIVASLLVSAISFVVIYRNHFRKEA